MKFKQFLVPIMAMVFAIGMSFTTEKSVANVYINDGNDNAIPVMAEDCGTPIDQCYGQYEIGGQQYELFLDQALKIPIEGAGSTVRISDL